jgi:hypothetical protein
MNVMCGYAPMNCKLKRFITVVTFDPHSDGTLFESQLGTGNQVISG